MDRWAKPLPTCACTHASPWQVDADIQVYLGQALQSVLGPVSRQPPWRARGTASTAGGMLLGEGRPLGLASGGHHASIPPLVPDGMMAME